MTSANTITSGSSGLTTPSPSPSPSPTTLTLNIQPQGSSAYQLSGTLMTNTGSPVAGGTITFTVTNAGGEGIPIAIPSQVTDGFGGYSFEFISLPRDGFVTAHYAGAAPSPANAASDSESTFIPPPDGN